jgi:hypothetical protein
MTYNTNTRKYNAPIKNITRTQEDTLLSQFIETLWGLGVGGDDRNRGPKG